MVARPDIDQLIRELDHWVSELDRAATDLQELRRRLFEVLIQLKTGVNA